MNKLDWSALYTKDYIKEDWRLNQHWKAYKSEFAKNLKEMLYADKIMKTERYKELKDVVIRLKTNTYLIQMRLVLLRYTYEVS